jgi:long-subunit acyl-CoA synthetase (AMP-forming)
MQETSNMVTVPMSKRKNPHSVGKFIEGLSYKFIENEIAVRGPNVASSYFIEKKNINSFIMND